MSLKSGPSLVSALGLKKSVQPIVDLSVHFCGYESRCIHVHKSVKRLSRRQLIVDFASTGILSYDKNKEYYDANILGEYVGVDATATKFRALLLAAIRDLNSVAPTREIVVLLDISSATRLYIATFFEVLYLAASQGVRINAVSAYSFSEYAPPPEDVTHASVFGPVTPFYSGWDLELESPITLVVGLGYEPGRALGAIEFLEPSKVIVFRPKKGVGDFDKDISSEVGSLSGIECRHIVVDYDVNNFETLFWQLDSAVSGLIATSRVVIVPFGPKLFALASVLVAIRHRPKVHLYRVSGGAKEIPIDKKADVGNDIYISTAIDYRISSRSTAS